MLQAFELVLGWSVKVSLDWLLYSEPEGDFSVFVENANAIAIGKWIVQRLENKTLMKNFPSALP